MWLTLGMPLDRGMFELEPAVTGSALDKAADDGVRAFLAAYSG